jgi:hypothetical protein
MNWARHIIIILLFSGSIFAQAQQNILNQRFSFYFHQLSAEALLDTVSRTTGYSFAYNPEVFSDLSPVTATFAQESLLQILQEVFKNKEFQFKEVCNYITITKRVAGEKLPDVFTPYIDSSEYYYIKARVMDANNKKPVSFANVVITRRNLGTVTNLDGNFSLKIPSGCINDSLIVSFIGYQSVAKRISGMATNEQIILQPVATELSEVIVKHYEPINLIRQAVAKVSSNYSTSPQMQVGFYRETSKQNEDYIQISEAVLKIFKAAYDQNFQTDQVIVFKSRKSPIVKTMDTVSYKLQGGIYNSLMIDLAKYPASFMSDDYFDMYDFKFEGLTKYNEGSVYVISFDQRPEVEYPLYKGKLYIDAKSLAIVKSEFGISPYGLTYATNALVKKSSSKIRAKVLGANYLVSYTNVEDRWQLHHMREEIKIRVRKKYSFFNSTFHSVSELVITDADSVKTNRFRNADLVKPNHVFAEVTNHYDETFWGKFNFIEPEISLEEAYRKIKIILKGN